MYEALPQFQEPEAVDDGAVLANKGKLLIGLIVLVSALGYLGFVAFQSATVYYYTVDELKEIGPTPVGKTVRVSGKLVPDSFLREGNSTEAHFVLFEGTEVMPAVHDGVLPDLFFNEHSEIILEGTYSPEGVFNSRNVIVKCPSKYIAEG